MLKTTLQTLALIAVMTTPARAQTITRVPVAPDSKLWIEGTSNLHDWNCKATTLDAAIMVDSTAAEFAVAAPRVLKKVDVKVPVVALKCNHAGMDGNLRKALKADKNPEISYILATFEPAGETKDSFTLHTTGRLMVAGVENAIAIDVAAQRLPDGSLKATGTVPIKMTDYGIQPPRALFGTLRTGDEVKVKFELTIGGHAIAAAVNDR